MTLVDAEITQNIHDDFGSTKSTFTNRRNYTPAVQRFGEDEFLRIFNNAVNLGFTRSTDMGKHSRTNRQAESIKTVKDIRQVEFGVSLLAENVKKLHDSSKDPADKSQKITKVVNILQKVEEVHKMLENVRQIQVQKIPMESQPLSSWIILHVA